MKRALPSLKAQALALLARREHSRAELRNKLLQHARKRAAETPPEADPLLAFLQPDALPEPEPPDAAVLAAEVDAVLDWLAAQRYQSDARFIESRVNARASRLGQARIRHELARHGVALDAETAQQLRSTELARAREVWLRRFGEVSTDPAVRAKQMRFLAARGFGADVIRRIVGGREPD
jgi:regulatory protein